MSPETRFGGFLLLTQTTDVRPDGTGDRSQPGVSCTGRTLQGRTERTANGHAETLICLSLRVSPSLSLATIPAPQGLCTGRVPQPEEPPHLPHQFATSPSFSSRVTLLGPPWDHDSHTCPNQTSRAGSAGTATDANYDLEPQITCLCVHVCSLTGRLGVDPSGHCPPSTPQSQHPGAGHTDTHEQINGRALGRRTFQNATLKTSSDRERAPSPPRATILS